MAVLNSLLLAVFRAPHATPSTIPGFSADFDLAHAHSGVPIGVASLVSANPCLAICERRKSIRYGAPLLKPG